LQLPLRTNRDIAIAWREQRTGYSDTVVGELIRCLVTPGMHYENILGHLEVQYKRPSQLSQEYHGLYQWLVEFVYRLLNFRHLRNREFIETGVRSRKHIKKYPEEKRERFLSAAELRRVCEVLREMDEGRRRAFLPTYPFPTKPRVSPP
jgi:hypothetical protein